MNRLKLALVLALGLFGGGSSASAALCGSGFSSTESSHTVFEHACYEFYFNNAGSAISSANVVVFDYTGTGVNMSRETSGSKNAIDTDASDGDVDNVGTYITTTTTADSELVVGVVDDDSCANQSYCRVQVKGPRTVLAIGADAPVAGDSVGTSTTAGAIGDAGSANDGTLGVAFQSSINTAGTSGDLVWVYIDPSRAE